MEVNVCRICKKTFMSRGKAYCCENCKAEDEQIFSQIEDYLMQFPNSNAMQLSENLDVPIETIVAYIDEGRLTFSKGHFEKMK